MSRVTTPSITSRPSVGGTGQRSSSGCHGPGSSVTACTASARVAPSSSTSDNPSASSASASSSGIRVRWLDTGPPESSRTDRRGQALRGLLRSDAPELLPDRLGPPPHLDDLDAAGARVADPQLALDARVVEQLQRAVDRRGG